MILMLLFLKRRILTYKRSSNDNNVVSLTGCVNVVSIMVSLKQLYSLKVPTRAAERPSSADKGQMMKTSRWRHVSRANQNIY